MITNLDRESTIAIQPWLAHNTIWRMRGMLGRRFDGFDAMVFDPCGSIHMWFMAIPLDVIFLDRQGQVVGLEQDLQPWRLASARGARITIELPVGVIAASQTAIGDQLDLGPLPPGGTRYSD